jgi:hypothetical protein
MNNHNMAIIPVEGFVLAPSSCSVTFAHIAELPLIEPEIHVVPVIPVLTVFAIETIVLVRRQVHMATAEFTWSGHIGIVIWLC